MASAEFHIYSFLLLSFIVALAFVAQILDLSAVSEFFCLGRSTAPPLKEAVDDYLSTESLVNAMTAKSRSSTT